MVGLCLFSLMPLDLVLSGDEAMMKARSNGFTWIPFADFDASRKSLVLLLVAACRVVPFTLITTLSWGRATAIRFGACWAILLEVVKIPIFSRAVSVTDVLVGIAGVLLAASSAKVLLRLALALDRAFVWFVAALMWSVVMFVGFWSRFDQIVLDRDVLYARLQGILGRSIRPRPFLFGVPGW